VIVMTRAVVVRYETRGDVADRNQELIEQVFAELNARDPGGLRYTAARLADRVSFVHVAVFDGDVDPFAESSAFRAFQDGLGDRLVGPPIVAQASIIGCYMQHH
jgi:hypothetical protein